MRCGYFFYVAYGIHTESADTRKERGARAAEVRRGVLPSWRKREEGEKQSTKMKRPIAKGNCRGDQEEN